MQAIYQIEQYNFSVSIILAQTVFQEKKEGTADPFVVNTCHDVNRVAGAKRYFFILKAVIKSLQFR